MLARSIWMRCVKSILRLAMADANHFVEFLRRYRIAGDNERPFIKLFKVRLMRPRRRSLSLLDLSVASRLRSAAPSRCWYVQ